MASDEASARGELAPERLRRACDAEGFACETTADLRAAEGLIGQPRATAALTFALGMPDRGYHIFVAGATGVGKMTAVNAFLAEAARTRPTPDDWCYVYSFRDPERPRALRLPPGLGQQLKRDLDHLLATAQRQLPRAFESDEYTRRRDAVTKGFEEEREGRLALLGDRARAEGFLLQATPMGLLLVPLIAGRPMREEEFAALTPELRDSWQRRRGQLEDEIAAAMKAIRQRERDVREELDRLDHDVALYAVGGLLEDLTERYAGFPAVVEYLAALRDDMANQLDLFRPLPEGVPAMAAAQVWQREQALRRYQVNVVVDRGGVQGAPVVHEMHPTYQNLIGRIDKEAQFGLLVTDFTLVRAGALHQANGGYLVLEAQDVLRQPLAWDGLKRALRNRSVAIEEAADWLGMATVRTLRPETVPLDLKVVLVGEPYIYYLLHALDPDFRELFGVRADFDLRIPRTPESEAKYAEFVCRLCVEEQLRPFDRRALALIVEHGARLAEDQDKLSARFGSLADLIREANYWAGQAGATTVTAAHVQQGLEQQVYRSSMVEERIRELIARGTLHVDVEGAAVGQVNGLAVHTMADYSFGRPSRITAAVGVGREGVLDIEREAELGGKVHRKGVLILAGFLIDRFAQAQPLTLHARLAFEQSYEEVEGDSASSAELYALLSRLADAPIRQGLAVTGSVDQRGRIQAIGGVNEKIEGFFAVCKANGLTGEQGVLIPASNVSHLMLKQEVIDAVQAGRFHIYAVGTVDEGIELLTGLPAGARQPDGSYPEGSINGHIAARMREMAQALRAALGPEARGEREAG
ncbi:MAG: AAA family ATPase, partial [Chloroflexi bacterium]|nr:AAA family ATPase [Chloroflexota bacterium]